MKNNPTCHNNYCRYFFFLFNCHKPAKTWQNTCAKGQCYFKMHMGMREKTISHCRDIYRLGIIWISITDQDNSLTQAPRGVLLWPSKEGRCMCASRKSWHVKCRNCMKFGCPLMTVKVEVSHVWWSVIKCTTT